MNTPSRVVAAVCVATAAMAVMLGAALALRPARTAWWTDGASVRERRDSSVARRVLWRPSEPVPGVGEAGADTYEARFSFDGSTMVFVRRRPGKNADLFTARRTPSGWTEPEPIAAVNTEHEELGPELSFGGEALYFYSDRPGGLGGYDLWVSRADVDGWGTPVNLGPAVNTDANEYGPALTPDGSVLYFSSNRARPGESGAVQDAWPATMRERRARHDYDLYASRMDGTEPAPAAPVGALNTANDEGAPAVSPGGDFLYLASDRPGGLGGFDLYRSRLGPGGPGVLENLGGAVNSAANDLDPGLSADGFRLCFSSDRSTPGSVSPEAGLATEPRYTLWQTVSREVYEEIETDRAPSRLAAVWDAVWPWLLLLGVMGLLLALLLRILRHEAWRRRLGQLSLLARCVVLSLLIHAMVASGLAVWKVGSGIIEAVRHEGGSRVVLTSAGDPGGAAGELGAQLLGAPSGEPAPVPELAAVARTVSPELIRASQSDLALPPLMAPTESKVELGDHQRSANAASPAAVQTDPGTDTGATEAAVPEAPAPAPTAREAASRLNDSVPAGGGGPRAPLVRAPESRQFEPTSEVSVDEPPVTIAPVPLERRAASSVAATGTVSAPAPDTDRGAYAAPELPQTEVMKSSAEPAAQLGVNPSNPAPAPVSAPRRGVTRAPEAPLPAASDFEQGTGGVRIAERTVEAPSAGISSVPAPSAPARNADVGTGLESALPRLASREPGEHSEGRVERGGAIAGLAPVRAGAGPAGAPSGPPRVDMPVPAAAGREGDGAAPLRLSAGSRSSGVGGGRDVGPTQALPPRGPGGDGEGVRLPEIPSGPVTPVETFAQRAPEVREEVLEKMGGSAETERAVARALEWFARHQERDGRWTGRRFDDGCGQCGAAAEFDADAAMTGMALLCYLGAGHTHRTEGPYRDSVDRAIRWLVERQAPDGDLRRGETMYGQTVATVALCEALAMTGDQTLAGPARRAVTFVLIADNAARRSGRADQDTAVLGWLVMAVESARRAGIQVPRDTFVAAEKWLDYVAAPGAPGRYGYRKGEAPSVQMTAEAMFVRQLVGHARTEARMADSASYILGVPPRWTEGAPTLHWYYATLALFEHQGDAWSAWNGAIVPELLAHQRREGPAAGSWDPQDRWSRMGGRIYQTAVCTLSLEVYYRYAPRPLPAAPAR